MNLIQSTETWLAEVCNDPEMGPCTAIALVHMAGTVQEDVFTKAIPQKVNAESLADWADLFVRKAEQYAEGLAGTQTFCLLSFHGDGRKPGVRKSFPVRGYVEQDGLLTENPTGKGVLQQMMRLVNDLAGQYARKDAALFDMLMRRADLDTKTNLALRQENVQLFDFSKDLVLKLADRTQEHKLAQIEAQSTADLKKEAVKTGKLLLNAATGREIIPQQSHDSILIEEMIDVLGNADPSQLMNMCLKDLPPQLLAALVNRFQRGMEARQKEAQVRKTVDEDDRPIDGGLQ